MSKRFNTAIRKLMKSDNCSSCKGRYPHNSRTYSGVIKGRPHLVCEECVEKLDSIHGAGVYVARGGYDAIDRLAEGLRRVSVNEAIAVIGAVQKSVFEQDARAMKAAPGPSTKQ